MLKRLWHALIVGHPWKERDVVFNPPAEYLRVWVDCELAKQQNYGFTDITWTCECGAMKERRLTGQHAAGDPEIESLRKMAGLSGGSK